MFQAKQEYTDRILAHLKHLGLCTHDSRKYQLHTILHKQAFLAVSMSLGVNITKTSILHDTDKLVLYGIMTKKEASSIHKNISTHHFYNCIEQEDKVQCILDYECGRFTKRDKCISAYDYILRHSPDYYEELGPTLEILGLTDGTNIDNKFEAWRHCNKRLIKSYIDLNIKAITLIKDAVDNFGAEEAVKMFYANKLDI